MVHCHNLVHEDHNMMTQFAVGWKPGEPDDNDPITAAPCQEDDLPDREAVAPGRCPQPKASVNRRGQVRVIWTAPDDGGGDDLIGYRIRACTGGMLTRDIIVGRKRQHVVRGLRPDRAYTFTVAAINRAGAGPQSPRSRLVVSRRPHR